MREDSNDFIFCCFYVVLLDTNKVLLNLEGIICYRGLFSHQLFFCYSHLVIPSQYYQFWGTLGYASKFLLKKSSSTRSVGLQQQNSLWLPWCTFYKCNKNMLIFANIIVIFSLFLPVADLQYIKKVIERHYHHNPNNRCYTQTFSIILIIQ